MKERMVTHQDLDFRVSPCIKESLVSDQFMCPGPGVVWFDVSSHRGLSSPKRNNNNTPKKPRLIKISLKYFQSFGKNMVAYLYFITKEMIDIY